MRNVVLYTTAARDLCPQPCNDLIVHYPHNSNLIRCVASHCVWLISMKPIFQTSEASSARYSKPTNKSREFPIGNSGRPASHVEQHRNAPFKGTGLGGGGWVLFWNLFARPKIINRPLSEHLTIIDSVFCVACVNIQPQAKSTRGLPVSDLMHSSSSVFVWRRVVVVYAHHINVWRKCMYVFVSIDWWQLRVVHREVKGTVVKCGYQGKKFFFFLSLWKRKST